MTHISVLRETMPGERRVALVPSCVATLVKKGLSVRVETGAGAEAGFSDDQYEAAGATVDADRAAACDAQVVLRVCALGADRLARRDDAPPLRPGQMLVALCDPLTKPERIGEIASSGATVLALDLVPRSTRAQAMDVMSSLATVAGYRAALLAAHASPDLFPMVSYAGGILRPARVFVVGVGVAGLRAIATARQLGAVVQAHDIRPASQEEARSVGAKFVALPLDAETQDRAGYARALSEEDSRRQRELIARTVAENDIVILTAAVPGRKAPLLLTQAGVEGMKRGSLVVDLAAERGGNCELTQPDQRVDHQGVLILGPTNPTSEVPRAASQMFAANVTHLLLHLFPGGKLGWKEDDEIVSPMIVVHSGQVVHVGLRERLGLGPLPPRARAVERATIPFDDEGEVHDLPPAK